MSRRATHPDSRLLTALLAVVLAGGQAAGLLAGQLHDSVIVGAQAPDVDRHAGAERVAHDEDFPRAFIHDVHGSSREGHTPPRTGDRTVRSPIVNLGPLDGGPVSLRSQDGEAPTCPPNRPRILTWGAQALD